MDYKYELIHQRTKEAVPFNELLSKNDIVALIKFSVKTVERMIASGEFPEPTTYIRGYARWCDSVVLGWINTQNKPKEIGAHLNKGKQ